MALERFDSFGQRVTPGRSLKRITATFTRPSDTTAYTAGDVVGPVTTPAAQSFAGAAKYNGGSGQIIGAHLETDLATITNGTFRVHVWNTTLTPATDNSPLITQHAQIAYFQGSFDFNILVADNASAVAGVAQLRTSLDLDAGIPLDFVCASGDTGLYCVITALAAYTPKSAGVFNLSLLINQD
jgi:hypothetical protein